MSGASPVAARIGIDWADQKHDVSLQETGSAKVEQVQIGAAPEALTEWLTGLRRRFPGATVAIAVETSRGPLIHALLEHDFVRIYPVNPRSLKRFREAFSPSGAKDDVPDADLLRELLTKHEDRLHVLKPDTPETRALLRLTENRRGIVNLRTKLIQQLRATLKEYFPQALSWAGDDLGSRLACDFLLKWPTLDAIQGSRPATIRSFYHAHNCRSRELIDRRIREVQTAVPLTTDPAIVETSALLVQTLARQLKALIPSIAAFDKEIADHFGRHEDAFLFESLPGSGSALAPRLLAAFGSDRDRFRSALDMQQLSGIAPVTERSGKSQWVHWRWSAPTFLRQTFHEFAHHSIRSSQWAKAYYTLQRERGKNHQGAVRALAYKWIRILWSCWQHRRPYDEARYIETLHRRGSPLAQRISTQTLTAA